VELNFDVRPFWLIGALCGNGFGLLVLIVRRGYQDYLRRALAFLGAANLCLGVSYFMRYGQAWDGQFAFHVLTNTLVAACLSLEYRAVCELKRRAASAWWIFGPPGLMFVFSVWFAYVQRNITVQLVFANSINMATMFFIAWTLWRAEHGVRLFVNVLTAIAYTVLGLATFAVIVDYFRAGDFSVEYNFNVPRSLFNNVAAIVTEGVVFPLFLLMVSERLNRDLVIQAMHDPLTGLYNRRAFEEIAFRELSGATRSGFGISLLIFDLDDLKQINDRYGHPAGDAVIQAAAEALRGSLRDEDFLCRWGGDEFCALLPRAGSEQAQSVAERVLQSFHELGFSVAGKAIEVTVSGGIVTTNGHAKDLTSLVRQADEALYRAKRAGRKQVAVAYGLTEQ
jgi:diguanylate cyclase (GGDEF)-like protein